MTQISRRTVVKGMAAAGAVAAFPAIAACGDSNDDNASSSSSSGGKKAVGTVTFGSNAVRPGAQEGLRGDLRRVRDKSRAATVKINTVDHNTFQEQINSYLQGRPDDVFTWFAGYRMQFFAQRRAWRRRSPTSGRRSASQLRAPRSSRRRRASTASSTSCRSTTTRGRSSTARASSRRTATRSPRRSTSSIALGAADEEGRPDADRLRRQGRLAGDGHVRHPQHAHQRLRLPHPADGGQGVLGRTPRSRRSSTPGSELLPLHQAGSLGRTWQEAAQSVAEQEGRACTCSACSSASSSPARRTTTSTSSRSPRSTRTSARTRSTRRSTASCSRRSRRTSTAPRSCSSTSATGEGAEHSTCRPTRTTSRRPRTPTRAATTPLQKKAAELIGGAKHIAQFLDRDTGPDFASTVMIPALQKFIKNPNDVDGLAEEHRAAEEDDLQPRRPSGCHRRHDDDRTPPRARGGARAPAQARRRLAGATSSSWS